MKTKVLFINACVRDESRTYRLCKDFLNKFSFENDCEIKEVTLEKEKLEPLYKETLLKREKDIKTKNFSHQMYDDAKVFKEVDLIVIGAPFWDFSFPALLKIYLENICVNGITFKYSEKGIPVSLCNAKNLVYITTSGGSILGDSLKEHTNELFGGLFGIENRYFHSAQGLDILGNDIEKILEDERKNIFISLDKISKTIK